MSRTTITRRSAAQTTSRARPPPRPKTAAPAPLRPPAWKSAPAPGGTSDGFVSSARPAGYSADLSSLDPAALATLKGGSPQQQRLAVTIERARAAYGPLLTSGARVTVSTPPGNGGEPVLTLVAKGFDATRPFSVQTHFHGWNSSVAEPAAHGAQVTTSITAALARDPQGVFVLPECANIPTNSRPVAPGAQNVTVKTDWSNVQDITATTHDALAAAGIAAEPAQRIVSAHSGGGRALGYAMQRHADGSGLKADRVELYDCLYAAPAGTLSARSALQAWLGTPTGAQVQHVTYFEGTGGNGEKPNAALLQTLGARYEHHGVVAHDATVAQNLGRPRG